MGSFHNEVLALYAQNSGLTSIIKTIGLCQVFRLITISAEIKTEGGVIYVEVVQ